MSRDTVLYLYRRGITFNAIGRTFMQEKNTEGGGYHCQSSGCGNENGSGCGWGIMLEEPPDNRETSVTAGAANGSGS